MIKIVLVNILIIISFSNIISQEKITENKKIDTRIYNENGVINLDKDSIREAKNLAIGYKGSTQFPYGFWLSKKIRNIHDKRIKIGIELNYQFTNSGYYDFNFTFR